MKKVEVYKSMDGLLEADPKRAAAHDMEYMLPKAGYDANRKVLSFSECLAVLNNINIIKSCIKAYEDATAPEVEENAPQE